MKKKQLVRPDFVRIMWSAAVFIIGLSAYTVWTAWNAWHGELQRVDEKLANTMQMVKFALPAGYVDRAADLQDESSYETACDVLTQMAREQQVSVLYTLAIVSNQLFVTAANLSEKERGQPGYPEFGEVYEEGSSAFSASVGDTNIFFETFADQWGHRRAATVTEVTPAGTSYLVGADYMIDFVYGRTRMAVVKAVLTGMYFLLLALPSFLILNMVYFKLCKRLNRVNSMLRADMRKRMAAEKQLQQACNELKGMDLMKGRMLNLLTHELKTPLSGIVGFSDLLQGEGCGLNDTGMEYVGYISSSAKRLNELVEKGTLVEQLQRDSVTLDYSVCAVKRFLKSTVQAYLQLHESTRMVQVDGDGGLQWSADWGLVGRALGYLLDNAIKYSEAETAVEVSLRQESDRLSITVSDHGCGIKPEQLESITAAFQVSDIEHHSCGHKLSLAVCRCVAQVHHGEITVTSEVNVGTQVCITLQGAPEA